LLELDRREDGSGDEAEDEWPSSVMGSNHGTAA
jgi:hypothetical protein